MAKAPFSYLGVDIVMSAHVAAGLLALLAGAAAFAARKGGPLHARAGTAFAIAMLGLWVTATPLDVERGESAAALANLFIAYFVATSWLAARRREGATGRAEVAACVLVFAVAAVIAWGAASGAAPPTPVGRGPLYGLAGACAIAGLHDLNAILRPRLTAVQRISRHLWRMCAAFFIATGSFFLGQQDVLPGGLQGSPILLALAFAPFAAMAFWLVRLRFGRTFPRAPDALANGPAKPLPDGR